MAEKEGNKMEDHPSEEPSSPSEDPPIENDREEDDETDNGRLVTKIEDNTTPLPILNGLKLKQKDQKLPFKAFHYTPIIRYPPNLPPVDWYLLSLYDIVGDHIRIHELKEGDDLLACIKGYRDNHAKAVIVVNTSEDMSLPEDLTQPLTDALNSFLVAVLPSSEGSALIDCLQVQFEDDELYAKLDVISSESTELAVLGEDNDTAVLGTGMDFPVGGGPTQHSVSTATRIGKLFGGRSSVFDLKSEVKKIVFENEMMKPVTPDAGLFTMVMATFSTFEKFGKTDTTHVNELLKRFGRYLEASFHFEFPFYLILVYRLRKFRQLYECEELGPFIIRCIDMFEVLPTHQLAKTLLAFLDKKDFDIMFGSEEANSSVFTLLATAARSLINVSMQLKRSNKLSTTSKRAVYCRLLWISIYLKCLSEKGIVNRTDLAIWDKEFILMIPKKTPITKELIEDFKLGLELSNLLKIPAENQFSTHHLGCFLADEKSIRPFAHSRDVVIGLEEFITSDKELLVHILINLRALYTNFLRASDPAVVGLASVEGTLLGTLDEGISFLDNITELWTRKGWHKGEQHGDFRAECLKWMMLLLGAVRVTDPNAPQLLKKFLAPKRGSVIADSAYRTEMVQYILEGTRAKFPDLTIQQFYPLYKSFRIWPVAFLRDYLKQYQIPVNVNIADPTWSEFFVEVLNRYTNSVIQNFIMDFIIRVAEKYRKAQKSRDFIPDILKLNIALLFIPTSEEDDSNIENRFTDFLRSYIKRNALRPVIIERIQEILSIVSEDKQTMFHWIVLNVLQQEVIPELKSLQDDSIQSTKQFKDLLKLSVNTVSQKVSWFGVLSPRQRFCWGVISAGCSKIPISAESFEWLISLQSVISQLGSVFNSYCNSRQLLGHTCLLTESLPQEVVECQWEDVRNYFNWIRQVQDILGIWQNKFLKNNVNFDEILTYASHNVAISSLGRAVRASDYVMDLQDIQGVKESFMVCFEQLNCYLIKYIPNHPESKYCTLVELLLSYGVHFPPDLQQKFQGKVIFPGNDRDIPDGQKLNNVINASVHSQFEPKQDVSLVVTKSFSLYDLQRILEDLQAFLEPIIEHMDMLVFFHLEKSDMFSKHLHKRLNDVITAAASPRVEQRTISGISFKPSINLSKRDKTKTEGVSMAIFQKGLKSVKDLLLKVLRGTATYSDIVAGDTLNLHELKTEEEFGKLRRFSEEMEMNLNYCEGLEGMRSMLELFQFTHHIEQIRQVCKQFQLTKCLHDDQFKNLLEIVKEFETVESRALLTPIEASDKMGFIKKVLCLEEHKNNYSCLELFPAVSNSVPFYQFIKDKQFVGQKGQTLFREQYQLITAQLQHEEYDENVLNHLRAAFEFIAPFTESDITFSDLMKKVTKLDTTNGLKQLETVNENITLITVWFSRAEGDTIENVANELQHILSTGLYQFQLSSNSCDVLLIYQTMQTVRTHKRAGSNLTQPLEESGELGSSGNKLGVTLPTVFPSPMPTSLDAKKEDPFGNTMGAVEQRWSNEQIADFVRKLGFLDSRKEGGDDIRKFLHLNSTANRMMELFIKLYELGHPKYQRDRNLPTLLCNTSGIEADKQVAEFEQTLVQWRNQVDALRQKYTWLLFFSVPKALCLYSMIDDLNIDYNGITREISFLFENTSNVRAKLRTVIKSVIDSMYIKMDVSTPMEFLGELLQLVCSDSTLAPHLLKQRCSDTTRMTSISVKPSRLSITSPTASGGPVGMFQLHYAPGYTQEQILRLITLIYKGVPECFEVLQCSPTTTAEELSMFMERVRYHPLPYLVLLVNRLPYKLQEQLSLLMKNLSQIPEDIGFGRGVGVIPTVHFIETSPSILREMPFVTYHEHKEDDPGLSFDEASRFCQRKIFQPADFSGIKLVYGYPGDGKTHYIRRQLSKCPATLCVSVNEAFTPLNTIKSLNSLPHTAPESAIFFNFTINPCLDADQNQEEHRDMLELMDTIGWFFYHLLVLGYIEDPATGTSYRLPGGQPLAIYIEVPSQDRKHNIDDCLRLCNQYIPILGLLGTPYRIHQSTPYCIDEEVQLVCKYLNAFDIGGVKGIDRLYREGGYGSPNLPLNKMVKFNDEDDLPDDQCYRLLQKYMPPHIQETKITQKLFIRYMKRRCDFLETNPAFNYNTGAGEILKDEHGRTVKTDTRQLGSTVMRTMLEEVSNFCDPAIKQNWSSKPHQQLIYDGSGSFGLLSLQPDAMPDRRKEEYTKIGFKLHSARELQQRKVLDKLLSKALNLPFHGDEPLSIIDDCNYVLTLDYTVKMLNIHERYSCGVPVIIKGETGVGKTALVDMLSQLWNNALLHLWNNERSKIIDAIRDLMSVRIEDSLDNYQALLEIVEAITAGKDVSISDLIMLGQMNDREPTKGKFHNRLRTILMDMEKDPAIALLKTPTGEGKGHYGPVQIYFENAHMDGSVNGTAQLLRAVLRAKVKTTFHKLNVHAALTPKEIKEFFKPVFEQALLLKTSYENADASKKARLNKMPFVTVFLDEVNTSSCLGLFKEIIVDKTLDGETIPENVFIVAACNPHRGNSMATHAAETWLRSSYFVRPLHPTLDYLMWDYGALDQYQERDYIMAKMKMLHKDLANIEVVTLSDLIVESQSLMRRYALRQLTSQKMDEEEAKISSRSCVSQRDIQRVFTFYQWLMNVYSKLKHHGSDEKKYSRRAVMVSLGIVYYMRLNDQYRKTYEEVLDKKVKIQGEVNFSQAFKEELDYFCQNIELPSGIAKTRALKENLFATIVCTVTHTPLVIVGAPGSSKTLSFNLAIANLKGPESKRELFRDIKIFKSLDPHYYQCSRRTTSNEIQTVFSRAINRQRSHMKFSLPIYCVVLMDEAGLPEESHESLKVLHYHLDKQEVSFVAITNHVLDAAKTNRAVSLFRPEVAEEDLKSLAKGCLCPNPDQPPANLIQDLNTIVNFCPAYSRLMDNPRMKRFFGLRDFIHFINYLRRRRTTAGITHQLVMEALERNFNGIYWSNKLDEFENICRSFLSTMSSSSKVKWRSILEVLKESLADHPEGSRDENEVRYKLVIDPTEDNSLMHLLIGFGVLNRGNTRIYVCSDFPGDSHIQKINTIAAIRHSAIEGHTVVMSQTDDIHESFYDLFNQRFRRIDDPEHGPRYYANIAIGAHLRPCRVHPDFVCVVVVKESEIKDTPAPFLNRFEKYCISHKTLLSTALNHLKPCIRIMLQKALEKVHEFINILGRDNNTIYGLKSETLDSLLLSLLPTYGYEYKPTPPGDPISDDPMICLLHELLRALRNSAGFAIPACLTAELQMDAEHILPLLKKDASFEAAFDVLSVETANSAVNEALQVLHSAPDPNTEGALPQEMSQEACLVVSVLQQWLIRHLCKSLMQLMTPEALCLHRKKIPASLIDNYLTNQQHFSLKRLLDSHLGPLQLQSTENNSYQSQNKLLCFTRSTSIIHHLPSNYPKSLSLKSSSDEVLRLKELVHDDLDAIQVCQIVSIQSQTAVQETLREFTNGTRKMLLLMANMQEATTELVNHLRVLIEEAEFQAPTNSKKLYVLLLHFPPAMFFDSCYPSLFLRGWNHYYLDSIGQCPTLLPGQLDIEEWLQRCCFPKKEFEEDSLMIACNHLLETVLPALTSHVAYGTRSAGPFTRDMKASERQVKLKSLLWDKGVGLKLCQMFRATWTPPIMTDYLEQAAKFTQTRESSLNITDAVQTMFQSAFTDFMVYMITNINMDHNLDVLFSDAHSTLLDELFVSLMSSIHPPKLVQLKTLVGSLTLPKPQKYQPSFPFFKMVYKSMEQLIEDSRKIKGNQENLFEEQLVDEDTPPMNQSLGPDQEMMDLAELIMSTIDDRMKEGGLSLTTHPVFISLRYIQSHDESIWDRYFIDLIHHTLHLDMTASPLSREIITAYFTDLLSLSPLQRFVYLHVYVQYNQVNLSNICSLLRPLEKIWQVAAESPHSLTASRSSPANDFIEVIKQTNAPFGDPVMLSTFVISALFSAIIGSIFPQESQPPSGFKSDIFKLWYRTYQKVMLMTALRSHLYTTPIPDCEAAKFNVMHTTYSVICSYPTIDEKVLIKGHNLFALLLEKYFNQLLQLKSVEVVPNLEECLTLANKMIYEVEDQSRILLELLFDHFLAHKRGVVSPVDRRYFLLLANEQYGWKASTQLVNETVVSSSYSEDLSEAVEKSLNRHKPKMRVNQKITSSNMAVYKKYLSLLLGNCSHSDEEMATKANPLMMYNEEVRQSIAETLANGVDNNEDTCPYIPSFYQDCRIIKTSKHSESLVMQQPLCHLYFATLLEHLMDEPRDVNALVRLVGTITQLARPQSVPPGEKIVLQIEKQAIIQCLLRQLALFFCGSTDQNLVAKELEPVLGELNDVLEDDGTGGGNIGGHRLTLGMHLLQKLKSHRHFIDMFNERYPMFKEVKCLSVFHEQLRAQHKSKPYLLPFMQTEDQSTLSKLYHQVKAAMLKVHDSKGSQADVSQFLKVAEDCFNARSRSNERIDKKQAFKMMVWLVAYYEFFVHKKPSQPLCQMVGAGLKRYINDENIIRLVQCFLNTRWFTKLKESPNPLREDAQILKIMPDGTAVRIDHGGEKVDPLYKLFTDPNKDESDEELCHCLANLVGVTLGCQPKSTHLWYHLFSPTELKDTYMTGFMYNAKISPEGLLYDCGVELTPDGQYGRPDYQSHATRGTYSLHSLYFLLWANFGTFCVSMLTLPESQSKLHGSIISDWQAIRHYCVSQVKTLWINLRDNLNLSDEERSFLVTRCLVNLYESNSEVPGTMLGKLKTREELDQYETFWDQKVFTPAWQELDEKFDSYSILWMNTLLQNLHTLEACYPLYPSERDFLNYINGLKVEDSSSRLLSKFAIEKQRLEVGGELLPSLIQLYQWLHSHLSHLVTMERAYTKLKIGQVIKIASRKVDPGLKDLYMKVKGLYNKYVELVGGAIGQGACAAVRRGNKIYVIDDDLPLIHFLSDSEEEGEGNDWLYAVIRDIAETQNLFVHSLYANVGNVEMGQHPLARLLTPEPASIFLAEANDFSCIVGNQQKLRGISPFLQLVRARLDPSVAYRVPGNTPRDAQSKMMSLTSKVLPRPSLSFNLTYLQEDIVMAYLSGKPIIEDISSLRTPFRFKEETKYMTASNRGAIDPMGIVSDYAALHNALPPMCHAQLDPDQIQYLEYEFHSSNYYVMTEIITGLKTAIGLLIKVVSVDGTLSLKNIEDSTLHRLIVNQYGVPESDGHKNMWSQALNQIGIKNLTDSQVRYLSLTKLPHLFSTLVVFVDWVKDGVYDFSSLPRALKTRPQEIDVGSLEQIPSKYPKDSSSLLVELKGLNEVLLHTEPYLIKEFNGIAQKPLMSVLASLQLVSENETLPGLIPSSILVHHYVQFRIILRKLVANVEQKVAMETSLHNSMSQKHWNEVVEDLWNDALPHLRDQGLAYIDPNLLMDDGEYGFPGEDWEEDGESELGGDLNKDSSETYSESDGSFQPHSMDFDDPLLYQDQPSYYPSMASASTGTTATGANIPGGVDVSVRDTLRQGLEDPTIRQEMLRMITKKHDIEQQAKDWSAQMVAQFIEGQGMKDHAKGFLEEEITGLELLNAKRDVYLQLGVKSHVECVKIAVMFKRELMGVKSIHCSMAEFILKGGKKFEAYEKALDAAGIDVDMLVFARQEDFLNDLLTEIKITTPLARTRFEAVLKLIVDDYNAASDKALQSTIMATLSSVNPSSKETEFVAFSTPV